MVQTSPREWSSQCTGMENKLKLQWMIWSLYNPISLLVVPSTALVNRNTQTFQRLKKFQKVYSNDKCVCVPIKVPILLIDVLKSMGYWVTSSFLHSSIAEPTESESSGLSAGAVAGIVIAIVFIAVIILVIILIAVCLCIKKGKYFCIR